MQIQCSGCNAVTHDQALSVKDFRVWDTSAGKRVVFVCPACRKNTFISAATLAQLGISESSLQHVTKISSPDFVDEHALRTVLAEDVQKKTTKVITASLATEIANQTAAHLADALQIGKAVIQRWSRNAILADQDLATYLNTAVVFYESYKASGLEKTLEEEKKARMNAELQAELWKGIVGMLAKKIKPTTQLTNTLEDICLYSLLTGEPVDYDAVDKILTALLKGEVREKPHNQTLSP